MMKLEKLERILFAVLLGLLALAMFGPHVAQPLHQHAFADQRAFGRLPFAMDVLSNVAFAAWGVAGLLCLRKRNLMAAQHAMAGLFFTGLIATAVASSWYHLQPDDAGLGIDRLGMVVAFAGLLGLASAERISARAGMLLAGVVLVLGALSIWFWFVSSNVLPWLVIQFGGMALIVWMAFIKPLSSHDTLAVRWGVVVAVYALAKLLELADHQIYEITGHIISGHSLKHLVASFAAWPVITAIVLASAWSRNQGKIVVTNSDNSLAH
jgi:hypothetical protein